MKRVIDAVRKILDPRGPLGEVVSPNVTFKERQGLPIQSPHSQRVDVAHNQHVPPGTVVTRRFVGMNEESAPPGLERTVGNYLFEKWRPVYAKADSDDVLAILSSSQTQVGWSVTQEVRSVHCDCTHAKFGRNGIHEKCGRARRSLSDEEFIEQVQQQQIAPQDQYLNGYYETIRGNDPLYFEGRVLTGGTRISGGRAEYNAKTKNMVHWDQGFVERRAIEEHKVSQAGVDGARDRMELYSKTQMPRKLGEL